MEDGKAYETLTLLVFIQGARTGRSGVLQVAERRRSSRAEPLTDRPLVSLSAVLLMF